MNTAILDYQFDQALLLSDRIANETAEEVDVNRIQSLFVWHGVVDDYTKWNKIDAILAKLGYDFDEIFEVIQ